MTMRCSICQQDCEVPFKPNPTFCQACYNGKASTAPAAAAAVVADPDELTPREKALLSAISRLIVLCR